MNKTFKIKLSGTKEQLFQFEIRLRMIRDFNRLGLAPDYACDKVGQLINEPLPSQKTGKDTRNKSSK